MSINHYSSEIPEALWWTQQHQTILMEPIQNHLSSTSPPPPNSHFRHHYQHPMYPTTHSNISYRFNLNQNEDDEDEDDNENAQPTTTAVGATEEEKEAMFEKPLTPSDVGKLNRLVIPKQHAEKYFPLGGNSGESKGLLLSFEDESGKCWRFRYSYWNSSQSYVLTKGWSRYVKEKRLDAGDVVLFERHRVDAQRFFIGWRRRQQSGSAAAHASNSRSAVGDSNNNNNGVSMGEGWTRGFYSAHSYPTHQHQPLPYQPHCLHAGISGPQDVEEQTTSPVGNSSRVLRLFGVNMECQPEHESGPSPKPECSYLSSTQGTATHHPQFYTHQPSYSPNSHNHMVRQQSYTYYSPS